MQHSRRRLLRSSAVALAGGVAGALGTRQLAQPTAADAAVAFDVTGDEVTIRDGDVTAVTLTTDVSWSYDLPSGESPQTASVAVRAARGESPEELTPVASTDADAVFLESSGEATLEGDLLEAGVVSADSLVPTEGGATTTTTVTVGVDFEVLDGGGTPLATASAQDTATLDVTQSDYDPTQYGSVSGSGELTLVVE